MNRRRFLAASLRLTAAFAAFAALPVLGGLAGDGESEAEPVYNWWQVSMSGDQLFFHDGAEPVRSADGMVWETLRDMDVPGVPLAARNVLVRSLAGEVRRWGIDTGYEGIPVTP